MRMTCTSMEGRRTERNGVVWLQAIITEGVQENMGRARACKGESYILERTNKIKGKIIKSSTPHNLWRLWSGRVGD